MNKKLRVLMTREAIKPERLPGSTVVVVDAFMATTTLVTILENGARGVYPVDSLEEAEEVCSRLDPSRLIRGGEQDALRIEGYDCGPFPEEYPPELVEDRDVVFVTTNGTRAISAAAPAGELLVGCIRNAPAVARHLKETGAESIYIVCAGSMGDFTLEDFLGATSILAHLEPDGKSLDGWKLNDAAWMALEFARGRGAAPEEVLRESRAGRWFLENDRLEDLGFVGEVGASDLVAEVRDGRLRRVAESRDRSATSAPGTE